MSGQTLTDRIAAAQYQLTGSDMARAVCKATTHEVMAPKKKHLEYLVSATNTTNVNIPQMADTLFERSTNASWVVVFKALVTTHHMCVHGNERFIQYLASRTSLFNLSNFIDKTGSHGYDMSTFIRRYGRYLNEKAFAYRQMAFDFTRVKKGAEGVMRTMTTEKLLKGMPVLQTQIDTLLEFDVHPKELNNGIINAAFMLLFKDLVKLFASYNDGIINLLEKYFKMKKSDCKEALEIYKRFLTRVTKIGEFMKLAETVGVDKNDIPDINYAPSSILESLETHMNGLEDTKGGKKGEGSPTKGSPTNNVSPTSTPAKSSNAVPTLQPPPGDSAAAAAAPEPAEDSLLDLDPLSSSGPSAPSAAPTSWGDLLGSEMGDSLLSEPTLTAEPAPSPAAATPNPAAAEPGVSLAPPTSTAAATSPGAASMDLLGGAFATPAPATEASAATAAEGGAAATSAPAANAGADPFVPSDGNTNTASSGLDLFSLMTVESNNPGSSLDACFTSIAPQPGPSPSLSPLLTSASSTITTTATISAPISPNATNPANDLFSADVFSSPAPILSSAPPPKIDTGAMMNLFGESTGGDAPAAAAPAAPSAELMSVFDGLGDVMKPTVPAQAGDVDTSMANMASNLTMGTSAAPQVAPPSWGAPMSIPMGLSPFMGTHPSFSMPGAPGVGAPIMPMVRPGFPATGATPGAPMSPGMAQSPRKPPPPRNALDDLNIKDFM
ncbi:clathrin coat assembly protein AP180-like isoform X1 [Mastacembelus armatus]|uniref:clathrin coat assembly protein AP180-like isoform X1 n=1 Tax=Mastacembelus armatus TaxID=205130 RepID=UPI000E45CB97|nr:clathrin coat assembly protein AP180-like isoform X1 [Mastacembelus armatus]XP_026174277.1 clathrin coat assembly protein AP180-like isoform X1 [Mastacembelus armatus]